MRAHILVLALAGCFPNSDIDQTAGVGATYTTRCSGRMTVRADEYFVECNPPSCAESFTDVADNHVVVAVDPGEKLVGYRERVCLQDLHRAAALFQPPELPPKTDKPSPDEPEGEPTE